ncbi:hypothetical protein D917_02389 [Trichinella nativa]|uniref:Uncharacterized protein n=1 Tax=Trichinella nativa TaxID=6335 RepID=A0A1Y3EJC5_9BILA|nr:hypothetical protein D917_02389 [Trichinella nativa]
MIISAADCLLLCIMQIELTKIPFPLAAEWDFFVQHDGCVNVSRIRALNIITASLAAVLSFSVQLYNVKTSKLYDHHNWLLASIRDNANAVEGDAK